MRMSQDAIRQPLGPPATARGGDPPARIHGRRLGLGRFDGLDCGSRGGVGRRGSRLGRHVPPHAGERVLALLSTERVALAHVPPKPSRRRAASGLVRGTGCRFRRPASAARRRPARPSAAARARFASWVRPYLPAPSRKWCDRERRVEGAGRRRRRCRRSRTPKPTSGLSSASQRAHSRPAPACAAGRPALEERVLVVRARVPAGAQQQPAALGQRAVLGLERARCRRA